MNADMVGFVKAFPEEGACLEEEGCGILGVDAFMGLRTGMGGLAGEAEAQHLESPHSQDTADKFGFTESRGMGGDHLFKTFENPPFQKLLLPAEMFNPPLHPELFPVLQIDVLLGRDGDESQGIQSRGFDIVKKTGGTVNIGGLHVMAAGMDVGPVFIPRIGEGIHIGDDGNAGVGIGNSGDESRDAVERFDAETEIGELPGQVFMGGGFTEAGLGPVPEINSRFHKIRRLFIGDAGYFKPVVNSHTTNII